MAILDFADGDYGREVVYLFDWLPAAKREWANERALEVAIEIAWLIACQSCEQSSD